jgi:molybdopterin-guanine dinucleotide biosynthesis protein A
MPEATRGATPSPPTRDCATIILAGGRGFRLGGMIPKALRTLAGKTLLERALDHARCWSDEVWVSAPQEMELPDTGYRIVRDHTAFGPRAGPLVALASALGSVTQPWALVFAVDMPLVSVALFDLLWSRRGQPATAAEGTPDHARALAVMPWRAHGPEPLFALYRKEVAAILLATAQAGERALMRGVSGLPLVRVPEDDLRALDPELSSLANINTREDWEAIEKRILEAGE